MNTMQLFMFMDPREWADKLATIDEDRLLDECSWDDEDALEVPESISVANLLDIVRGDEQQWSLDEYVGERGVERPILIAPDRWNWLIMYAGDNTLVLVDGHHRFTAAYDAHQLVPVAWCDDHSEWFASVQENMHECM